MNKDHSRAWITVDPRRYEKEHSEVEKGVEFHVFVSPYDLPEAVRGDYIDDKDRFRIEFKYIGDEPLERNDIDQFVTVYVGRHSHRLYRIDVNVGKLGATSIALRVSHAIDALSNQLGAQRVPEDNFRVAKDVISANSSRLLGPLTPG